MKLPLTLITVLNFSLFTAIILLAGCEHEETEFSQFNVTVEGKGVDCGDLYLIKVNNNLEGLYRITGRESWQTCYAYGLAEKYKVEGKKLLVELRAPRKSELYACTTLGPGYPWVTVVEVINATNE
ncbi:MAG: hypothetical protein K9J27_04520 [Bacteroidales bacterium]|nr:hypothetical protein [Bacteroidales bacterium]MCF8333187.1 hypothetical protein [Bacteroidales bacterium]